MRNSVCCYVVLVCMLCVALQQYVLDYTHLYVMTSDYFYLYVMTSDYFYLYVITIDYVYLSSCDDK